MQLLHDFDWNCWEAMEPYSLNLLENNQITHWLAVWELRNGWKLLENNGNTHLQAVQWSAKKQLEIDEKTQNHVGCLQYTEFRKVKGLRE